jgi:hypothetical protein
LALELLFWTATIGYIFARKLDYFERHEKENTYEEILHRLMRIDDVGSIFDARLGSKNIRDQTSMLDKEGQASGAPQVEGAPRAEGQETQAQGVGAVQEYEKDLCSIH